MANPYLILWCDPTQNKIYSGWQKNTQALTPVLKQGDEIGCEIHWVKTGEYTATMQEIAFPPSATVRLAVGKLDAAPLGGTFTLTYGGDTTDPLPYDIEATALETALNDLASITAEGGVTVSKTNSQFRIVWNDAGVSTDPLTSNLDMLYPTCQSSIVEARAGTVSASRIILLKVKQSVIAGQTSFTAVSAPAMSVTSIFANNWRVSASPNPKEGVFSLSVVKGPTTYTTTSISYNADAFEIAAALNSLNVVENQTFSVVKSGDFIWDITSPSAVDSITVTSGLIGFSAVYGVLNMNTAEVEEFLAGATEGDAFLEVEVDIAGEIQTLVQTRVRVINDLIDTSSFTLVDMGSVMPVDSVVRYDTSQALTPAQQLTARQNIDAVSIDDIEAALDTDNIPTNNEKAALQYSVLPSQTNPFVTMSERNPFDQSLNTTNNVGFASVAIADGTNSSGLYPESLVFNGADVVTQTSITLSDGTNQVFIGTTGISFPDSSFQTTAFDPSLYLSKAGNLSGLASTATARTNLGLGTMAVETATNYLAKSGNLSGLTSVSTARTNLGLGTMATEASLDYLSKNGNLGGITSPEIARANLQLGTMSTQSSFDYLSKAGNLEGINSPANARANIGLGPSADANFNTLTLGVAASGNYNYISNSSIALQDNVGKNVQISPSGIYTNGNVAVWGDSLNYAGAARIGEGWVVGENQFGVWAYNGYGVETGLTADGIVFSDGGIQTQAVTEWLKPSLNLSDVQDTTVARDNLGLGTMATQTATSYLAKSENLSGLASVSTARTNLGLGTMATQTATNYLAKSENLSGLASTATARTNLGLGSASTYPHTDFLQRSNNLSDISNVQTARTNLGLGLNQVGGVTFGTSNVTSQSFIASNKFKNFGQINIWEEDDGIYDVGGDIGPAYGLNSMRSSNFIFTRQLWAWGQNIVTEDDKPSLLIRKPDPSWDGSENTSSISNECIVGYSESASSLVTKRDFGFWVRNADTKHISSSGSAVVGFENFLCGITERGIQFPDLSYQFKKAISPKIGSRSGAMHNLCAWDWSAGNPTATTPTTIPRSRFIKTANVGQPSYTFNTWLSTTKYGTNRYSWSWSGGPSSTEDSTASNTTPLSIPNGAQILFTRDISEFSSVDDSTSIYVGVGYDSTQTTNKWYMRVYSMTSLGIVSGEKVYFNDSPSSSDTYDILHWSETPEGTALKSVNFVLLKNGVVLATSTKNIHNWSNQTLDWVGIRTTVASGEFSINTLCYQHSPEFPIVYDMYMKSPSYNNYSWPF